MDAGIASILTALVAAVATLSVKFSKPLYEHWQTLSDVRKGLIGALFCILVGMAIYNLVPPKEQVMAIILVTISQTIIRFVRRTTAVAIKKRQYLGGAYANGSHACRKHCSDIRCLPGKHAGLKRQLNVLFG
jgi:hypothetical protein